MSFGITSSRVLFSSVVLLALVAIVAELAAREEGREKKPVVAKPVAQSKKVDDPWTAKMKSRLGPYSAEQLETTRQQAVATLAKLEQQMGDLPDGAIWRTTWQLKALGEQVTKPKPSPRGLFTAAKPLGAAGPMALEPARRTLVYLIGRYLGLVGATPQSAGKLTEDIELLARAAQRGSAPLNSRDEANIRTAFRRLAESRLFDDLLADYRGAHSSFNYRVRMTDDYVEAESRKQFEIPVDFPTNAGGMAMRVRGTAVAELTTEVVPNETQGELRVNVASFGRFGVSGSKRRMTFSATSTQRLHSVQPMYLAPLGIETPGPTVRDRSCTALNWVQVCTRLPCICKLAARIIEPIAARKISEQDPTIARKVEDQVRERVAEEGFDIAHRVNGKFGTIGSEFFPNDGDKPRVTIRSTSDDITWTALYADADELGALTGPPADPADFDVQHWAHESAADNWGTRLDGKPLDEATFHSLLREDLKLFGPDLDKLPSLRRPAVLLFAPGEPLSVRFRQGAVELTCRVQGYALDSEVKWNAPRTVKLRYRAVADASGMKLVREAEDYLNDAGWKKVLDRFLPPVLTPLPQYDNANLKTRLVLVRLSIADGWIATGSRRVSNTAPPHNLAKESIR